MNGLIYKDFCIIKSNVKLFLLMAAVGIFLISSMKNSFFIPFCILFCAMLMLTTFSYDDMAKWNKYARTLPVTGKEIVLSKYILLLLLTLFGIAFALILTNTVMWFQGTMNLNESLIFAAAGFFTSLLMGAILMPLIFQFGTEKARLLIMLCFLFLPLMLIRVASPYIEYIQFEMTDQLVFQLLFVAAVTIVILFLLSILASTRIYIKKEYS